MKNRLMSLAEASSIKSDVTEFTVGDQVEVHQRILEGQKERVQVFAGVVIGRRAYRNLAGNRPLSLTQRHVHPAQPIEDRLLDYHLIPAALSPPLDELLEIFMVLTATASGLRLRRCRQLISMDRFRLSLLARRSLALGPFQSRRVLRPSCFGNHRLNVLATRCGYTGEDGFEILVPAQHANAFAEKLLADPRVKPIGLGARDSLRLEAGLCLYGNDIDETTNPVEAALTWVISKRRKMEWNFIGADPIRAMLDRGPPRLRVGIQPEGRAPARGHTEIVDAGGNPIGMITSGGFGPTCNAPVAPHKPVGLLSSRPIQASASCEPVNPANHESRCESLVPVLPAACRSARPRSATARAVPKVVTACIA